jgi:DNA-binding response OmpR family regulator
MREQPGTILIVDDEFGDRDWMASVLRAEGFNVLPAASYPEALRKAMISSEPIRLLISDLALPDHDGIELARSLTELTESQPSVLFISGRTGSKILPYHGLSAKDAHFLVKPFSR